MFKINYIEDRYNSPNCVELVNSKEECKTYAKIAINTGASLQELFINNTPILKENRDLHYASSILFPFANRINKGIYNFNGTSYKLKINAEKEGNAIHGLIYNKSFKIVRQEISNDYALISLVYEEKQKQQGFPFTYEIVLTYILTDTNLELNVKVKNTDISSFPFSIGWHPYFYSSNLYNSYLEFSSHQKIKVNEDKIPVDVEKIILKDSFQIKEKHFDDCFMLNKDAVIFTTPNYSIELTSSSKEKYIQIYTPSNRETIAIEPTTAPADCFNNKRGLQILNPNDAHESTWKINLSE